jgi:anti-anti-sigma factor
MDRDEIEFKVDVGGGRDGSVVAPRGELDMATQGELRAAIEQQAARGAVTLDLSGLRFLDTSGLRLILETAEASRREGFRFSVLPGNAAVQRLFDVAGVTELVPFSEGREGGGS